MARGDIESSIARQFVWASIANSLLLPAIAALGLNVTFWVLVGTNFVLMHAVWVSQLGRQRAVEFRLIIWPLVAFAVLANLALLIWGERLFSVFPA